MLLFLDFDGVLHPCLPRPEENALFSCQQTFEAALRERFLPAHPDTRIVISSSWRLSQSLDVLRGYFSPDIGSRIIAVTPEIDVSCYEQLRGSRQREIEQWLCASSAVGHPWIAIDDDELIFDDCCPHLVLCDTAHGFTSLMTPTLFNTADAAMRVSQNPSLSTKAPACQP